MRNKTRMVTLAYVVAAAFVFLTAITESSRAETGEDDGRCSGLREPVCRTVTNDETHEVHYFYFPGTSP